ncbi:MAG TPA: aldo/keto reductase [Gammaproteobacteria bacterium]|jgi:diketogulonate reductase-like aldo/keto reductase|nr:aldo/keto reductase [Gammaproteobacteria bacterium]
MDYKEAHGARIPALGFGTFMLKPADARRMVEAALEIGYRHIDTAQLYRNETDTGAAIAASGIDRGDIFLTTKVWIERFHAGDLEASADESLERLGTDYVDLLLLHWPNADVPLEETLEALMRVKQAGKAKHIGISNFSTALVQQAVELVGAEELVTNQVEYHVFLSQQKILAQARQFGMLVTAYCPLAQGKVVGNETLRAISDSHGKSEAQVALRWLLQQEGVIAIPRTKNEAHARANFEVFDFTLDDAEMRRIDQLLGDERQIDPEIAPVWDRP